jgi:hypothetical protein
MSRFTAQTNATSAGNDAPSIGLMAAYRVLADQTFALSSAEVTVFMSIDNDSAAAVSRTELLVPGLSVSSARLVATDSVRSNSLTNDKKTTRSVSGQMTFSDLI